MTTTQMTLSVPAAASSAGLPVVARLRFVVEVPAVVGEWSRGRSAEVTSRPAGYATTINAQAAKHVKATDPPRGTSV
jgi:hypothetical protein